MLGRDIKLPEGYQGIVFGKLNQQSGYLQADSSGYSEKIDFEELAHFDRLTEWKKDAWTAERGFAQNLVDYLECAKILNADE